MFHVRVLQQSECRRLTSAAWRRTAEVSSLPCGTLDGSSSCSRCSPTNSWSSRNFRKIVIYRERSPNIAKDRAISRNIAQCRAISRNIAQYRAPSRRTCHAHGAGQGAASQGGGGSTGRFCKSLNIAINRQKSLKIAKDREISRRRYCEKFRLDQESPLPMFRCPGHARTATARPGLPLIT